MGEGREGQKGGSEGEKGEGKGRGTRTPSKSLATDLVISRSSYFFAVLVL